MGDRLLNIGVLYTGWSRFLYSVHNPKDSLNVTLCLESYEHMSKGIEGVYNGENLQWSPYQLQ